MSVGAVVQLQNQSSMNILSSTALADGSISLITGVDSGDGESDEGMTQTIELVMTQAPCPWEFYITRQAAHRMPRLPAALSRASSSVRVALFANTYNNGCVTGFPFAHEPSLKHVYEMNVSQNKPMDETLVMFYAVELMRVVDAMHASNLVHGNVAMPTVLLRNDISAEQTVSQAAWNPSGSQGWNARGIRLTDFGRSIDLTLTDPNARFTSSLNDEFARFIGEQPWSFEIDYFGIASVLHALLFHQPISLTHTPAGEWALKERFKAYWQVSLWQSLFHALLNTGSRAPQPSVLLQQRESVELYLSSNPVRAKGLNAALMKQEDRLADFM